MNIYIDYSFLTFFSVRLVTLQYHAAVLEVKLFVQGGVGEL